MSHSLAWGMVNTAGSPSVPVARTYASLVSHGNSLLLYGGYGESKGRFNDVYEYVVPSHTWRLVAGSGEVPKPVYLHSAVRHGSNMIVFGGNSGKESADLFFYDLDTHHWIKTASPGFMSMGAATPTARYGHASCVYANNQLLVVGGCRSNNSYFKDTWSMDLESKKWRKLEDLPLDLAYHSLITWQDRAYLFGGYNGKSFVQHMYVLDSITGKWNILQSSGSGPAPMCGAATVLRGNELFVFGGYTEQGHTNELYRFNMQTRVWTLLSTSNKPLARAYLQAAVVGDRCFIFGGYDGSSCISDFRSIQLPPAQNPEPSPALSSPAAAASSRSSFSSNVNPNANANISNNNNNNNVVPFSESFFAQPAGVAVDSLLSAFASSNDYMSRAQLSSMVAALQTSWRAQQAASAARPASQPAQAFDTSKLSAVESLGFSREHVLKVMSRMHAAGQNTRNVDLVVDMCCRDPPEGGDAPSLDQGSVERSELQKKLQALTERMASQEDDRTCNVCMADPINCALQDCGHLCVCTSCAGSLKAKSAPCPICQRPIRAFLKTFWS